MLSKTKYKLLVENEEDEEESKGDEVAAAEDGLSLNEKEARPSTSTSYFSKYASTVRIAWTS